LYSALSTINVCDNDKNDNLKRLGHDFNPNLRPMADEVFVSDYFIIPELMADGEVIVNDYLKRD